MPTRAIHRPSPDVRCRPPRRRRADPWRTACVAAGLLLGMVGDLEGRAAEPSEARARASIRHLLLLAIAPDTPAAKLREIEAAMTALAARATGVLSGEWGRDLNDGARTQGFTHAFLLRFRELADVERYRADPAHRAFVELTTPHLAKPPLVLDYRATDDPPGPASD